MATEPEQSILDLTARTATADSDLLHINSGGTDYKQTKARFCNDIVQYIDFANTSSLTGQCDTLGSSVKSPAYFAGKINSYGHQSACGTPENNSYHVLLSIYSGNYHELTITDVDTGAIWRKLKINGTWQSSWVMSPTRNEITSLNSNLSNSKLHYKEHYFSNVTLPASTLYVNLGDIQTNFGIPSGSYYVSFFIRGWSGTGTSVISLAVASNSADLYLMGSQAFTGGAFTVRCWYVATN